jgi:hypothetical protein
MSFLSRYHVQYLRAKEELWKLKYVQCGDEGSRLSLKLWLLLGFDDNKNFQIRNKGVCHVVALPFTLKSILGRKKNYGNSNISPCQNIIFKKSSKTNQNLSRYY